MTSNVNSSPHTTPVANTFENNGCTGITEKRLKRLISYISIMYEESKQKDVVITELLSYLESSDNGKFTKDIEYDIFLTLRYGLEITPSREVSCMDKIPFFLLRKLADIKARENWQRPIIFKRAPKEEEEEEIFDIHAVIDGVLSCTYWNFFPLDLEID